MDLCTDGCEAYENAKHELQSFLDEWFSKDDIDCFLMPTYLHLPTSIKPEAILSSPTVSISTLASLAAFSSYPSVNVPIGLTSSQLPAGFLLLSKPDSFLKSLNVAKLYEREYGETKLPRSTPELNSARSNSLSIRFFYSTLFSLGYIHFKL